MRQNFKKGMMLFTVMLCLAGTCTAFGEEQEEIRERYEEILLNGGKFLCADLDDRELSLENIGEAVTDDENFTVSADKFAILDLDADGEDELILWLVINNESDCGFEVLHAQDEALYGYTLQYRSIMNLKTDGTFEFSGGSADTGIGKLKFSEEGPVTENLAYSESSYDADNELTVEYFADEKACSEEEFNTAMSEQAEKPDADWYELTADGVKAAFDEQAERR